MGMFADVIYGDKTVGAYAWVFFNDGANKHTPIITYHQIDHTNQSIRIKDSTTTRPSIFVQKREEISEQREKKNTSLFYEEEVSCFPYHTVYFYANSDEILVQGHHGWQGPKGNNCFSQNTNDKNFQDFCPSL